MRSSRVRLQFITLSSGLVAVRESGRVVVRVRIDVFRDAQPALRREELEQQFLEAMQRADEQVFFHILATELQAVHL
ncbi:hypothetical protein, partial [Escherichia coli]|uniref:hypothetical protein n=1 Tax=Escherichia coli TaxID=562 RepID=UPI001328170C